jgi:filamentous hemagglutinin family protein
MSRIAASARTGLTGSRRLKASASLMVLALAASVSSASVSPALAEAPFANMVGIQAGRIIGTGPNAQVAQWTGANAPVIGTDVDGRALMTIQQTQAKALLDWEDFRLQTNEVLEFQQQSADWIAVNRVHGNQAAEINGEIRAIGKVFVLNDNGVLIGKDAKINTRTLVTGQGISDVLIDGKTTTLVQSKEKAILDWSDMSLQAGEVLKFQQQKTDWVALNRSYNTNKTVLAGDVKADGHIYLVAPRGLVVDGKINAQQVVLSSLFMRNDQFLGDPDQNSATGGLISYTRRQEQGGIMNPTFTNTRFAGWGLNPNGEGYNPLGWKDAIVGLGDNQYGFNAPYYKLMNGGPEIVDANDPLKNNVTIGKTGSVTTGKFGKVMLFGPKVTNFGQINIQDEGQVIMAAGENVWLQPAGSGMLAAGNGRLDAYVGALYPLGNSLGFTSWDKPPQRANTEEWRAFYSLLLGRNVALNENLSTADHTKIWSGGYVFNGTQYVYNPSLIETYIHTIEAERAQTYTARNEGIISSKRGGSVVMRGLNLEQMGAIDMTSTALFRSDISLFASVWDWRGGPGTESDNRATAVPGHGTVVFGKGSLTQITPDLDSTDAIPVSSGAQSVGQIKINARSVHMQEDSIIHMPSGNMNVLLDAGAHIFDNNLGAGSNQGNEDGTRFLMERGAIIDLSGWETTLEMGYHQVTGKLYAAQLADSPLQRDGALYRQEISVDRRYGTNLANWQGLDNLSQGTLGQFLTNGGTLNMDIGDDFIMKSGSVIDVSGGVTTYKDGYVYTTLLRRLDGSIIDIREADPDELYMGLANQWTVYDTKWGKQTTYNIPLMTATQGRFETSYQHGGKGGTVDIMAPDSVLQGTLKGETVTGRYQRQGGTIPVGGAFILNNAGESEGEYVSNNILITARETALNANFGFTDKLSDTYGELFGVEFDRETDRISSDKIHSDNTTLVSADFFNRSTMGSYALNQVGVYGDHIAVQVEEGVNLNLKNGASFSLAADQRIEFLGSIRTEGGDVSLSGMSLTLGEATKIDTRGSWYSDYEIDQYIALDTLPRIHGGDITLSANGDLFNNADNVGLTLPDTVVLDMSGGAWVERSGKLNGGKGGNLTINALLAEKDELDLSGLPNARAYGLGGNGAFSLRSGDDIIIGAALPVADEEATGRPPLLFTPDFFENSGFSAINLIGKSVKLMDGVQVHATSASLQLKEPAPLSGKPPAFWAPSGTDIYDVAEARYLAPELRSPSLRGGMTINLSAQGVTAGAALGDVRIGEGSLLATEVGGKISLRGNTTVAGTILAPAGAISLASDTATGNFVHVTDTGSLLAPGVALITSRNVVAGRELIGGEIYDGGKITLTANEIKLDKGSKLDVSGTSATFDLQDSNRTGVYVPVTLASNGGSVEIEGQRLAINDTAYKANAGGAGARGGSLTLNWTVQMGGGGTPGGYTPAQVLEQLEQYVEWGYVTDKDFNPITSLYGIDLSTIAWEYVVGPLDFPPGYILKNRAEVVALFNAYGAAAAGPAPMLIIGEAFSSGGGSGPDIPNALVELFTLAGYSPPPPSTEAPIVTTLSPDKIAAGGFSALTINASPGVVFNGDVNLGGKKPDGSYIFDTLNINASQIVGNTGSTVRLEAGVVGLGQNETILPTSGYGSLLGIDPAGQGTTITVSAGTLLQVGNASFHGFEDTRLNSGGDIRFAGIRLAPNQAPAGSLYSAGKLTLKADQVYAGTGRIFSVTSDTAIEILAQDDGGLINDSPYEAAAKLTLKAPTIIQGGTLRSPLGTLTLEAYDNGTQGSGDLIFKAGSLTSVSGDGKSIPYGYTANGDTWTDPFTGLELTNLPTKALNLTADKVDLQAGSEIDVSGGGDLFAREFVPGVNGTLDWLTGYRDVDYNWVTDPGSIYAVIPDFEGNIAPLGFGSSQIGAGDKVYLSGGSGLKAGYYTLLPAEYALMPGAYRVTAQHRYSDSFVDASLGTSRSLTDGSSVQAGYVVSGASGARDQRTQGFHVMSGQTMRTRSFYRETTANTFFVSDAFLKKALRTNRPVGEVPRIPLDGGSVVFRVAESLELNGKLTSGAASGGRGGFADIASSKVVVAGTNTDLSQYDGYLVLKSEQLSAFGADSLLIGGTRQQGAVNMELSVSGTDIVIDNTGSVLFGPELLFASTGNIDVKDGAKLETRGKISGVSGDLRVLANIAALIDNNGTPTDLNDDITIHGVLDQGTVLRLSSGDQVDILRDTDAVNAANALRNDPAALALVNSQRADRGLAPLDLSQGLLNIADGASLKSGRSVALDATNNTRLGSLVTLETQQLSASASRVSIGAVPAGTEGLIFADGSLGALARAADLTLKSYSTLDLYGGVTLAATGALRLDAGEVRVIDANNQPTTLKAQTLALTHTGSGKSVATTGSASLNLDAKNVYFEGNDKWLSGINTLNITASERVIGRDDSTLYIPGALSVTAGGLTTESGARLFFDATGAINVTSTANATLPAFQSFGGTLGLTGASVNYAGQSRLTGGTINLQARAGDVVLAQGAVLDVTSNASQFFDKTVGVGAGSVNLVADLGDVNLGTGSLIDVSGSAAGGDAGTLTIKTGVGEAILNGTLKGTSAAGSRGGSFSLLTQSLTNFGAFNTALDTGGFRQSRRFEINSGDVTVDGTVNVQDFAVIANDGSVNVTGTVRTTGDNGGRIQVSAAEDVTLSGTGKLLASANAIGGAGGTVIVETTGRNGGQIATQAGSVIDVSGTGEGGRLVRFRAPQVGNDVAIGQLAGTITGARSVLAEGFKVYDGVSIIDQGVITQVSNDATAFMSANGTTIRNRLGAGVTLVAGIELRSDSDMELKDTWDLSGLRFDGAAGVLTLRAAGDLLINANLSDGFNGDLLLDGESWAFNLTAGANTQSPDTLAVLTAGQLAAGKGSVKIGGTADTLEYFYDPAYGNENRLYVIGADGRFVNDPSGGREQFLELQRDTATGQYIHPITGELIEKDPVTGDYADTGIYARRPLPWLFGIYRADGSSGNGGLDGNGNPRDDFDAREYQQWDNSTGYYVRTGTGAINVASARDLVLQERASVIYTAGKNAAPLAGFYVPTGSLRISTSNDTPTLTLRTVQYGEGGGDVTLRVSGDILASSQTPQLPSGYLFQRRSLDETTGLFASAPDRAYDQTSWWVDYSLFQGGIGALGGGNIAIDAGGDIDNLGVSIPNSGRVTGNTGSGDAIALTLTGGGNLSLRAGGNIKGGVFYVADGEGDLTAGGSFTAGSKAKVFYDPSCTFSNSPTCYLHYDPRGKSPEYDVYSMFFTSSGQFDIKSGGDLNIDGVMDPLLAGAVSEYRGWNFLSYTDEASVRLFSAGGDVNVWNNGLNTSIAFYSSGSNVPNPGASPLWYYGRIDAVDDGRDSMAWDLRPSSFSAIAATGDVRVVGGMMLMPSAKGNLELLAGNNVIIGYGTQSEQGRNAERGLDGAYFTSQRDVEKNQRGAIIYEGIFMSQADMTYLPTPTNPVSFVRNIDRIHLRSAGVGDDFFGGGRDFSVDALPDLHAGDHEPVRIYAAKGDIVTAGRTVMNLPKQAWFQAGGNIYFPSYDIQHNNPNDLSLVRAGKGIYFDISGQFGDSNDGIVDSYGHLTVSGPGRLEVEAGTDIYLPSNSYGISSKRITIEPGAQFWKPEEKAADIAISAGFNQKPSYDAFEDAYLNPEKAGEMADYLKDDTGKSLYLFDREYDRAKGATGEFAVPEPREGLVNYVRRLQGLTPLETRAEEVAYLDTAWTYWKALPSDYKTPYFRSVLFLELRTTGREANDADNERYNTTFRGYKAIETLFPGAQKETIETLAEGESLWKGDFETYASRVISSGGGKIEFVLPGGAMTMANVSALPSETGQPTIDPATGKPVQVYNPTSQRYEDDRGNAQRAGVLTTDGGEINVLTHASVTLNQSRLLTAKGGNVMIWSSWGDIAAGKGAQTSLSPAFFDYGLDLLARMKREPAGLPTGAGIGTLSTQDGTPPADVDLIAPAGVVDAGDAGIRVAGNFNVFAVEILGADNIDVGGVTSGLPIPPAAPPTSLDIGLSSTNDLVAKSLKDAISNVQKDKSIVPPSLIEVKATGSDEEEVCGTDENPCPDDNNVQPQAPVSSEAPSFTPVKVAVRYVEPRIDFKLPALMLDDAIRSVGQFSGMTIIYDSAVLRNRMAPALSGKMTAGEALECLLKNEGLTAIRVGPRSIRLERVQG